MPIKDLNGKTFGEWTVIEFSHLSSHGAMWRCRCSCGNIKAVRSALLTSGDTKSCGHRVWNRRQITWKVNENGCWICTSHKPDAHGYPQCSRNHRGTRISRVMYEKYRGPIPDGLFVCHKCDNTMCINPQHLFLGTHQDNMDDMNKKGRHGRASTKGEKHGMAKLTEDKVREIRNIKGMNQREIAKKYGLHYTHVNKIIKREIWKHV